MGARIVEMKDSAISEIESLGDLSEKSLAEVLRSYCKRMDASGLVGFIQSKRKEPAGLRMEIAAALESSVDPMRFDSFRLLYHAFCLTLFSLRIDS